MSLPPFSGAASAPKSDPQTPEKPEKPAANDGDGPGTVSGPTVQTRKRKREVLDDMDVGGDTSDEESTLSVELGVENSQITEPDLKRRRVDTAETGRLDTAREALGDALKQGDLNALKIALLKNPGCLNHQHPKTKATPLLEALWWGQGELVHWLLQNGADPDIDGIGFYEEDIDDGCYTVKFGELSERARDLSSQLGYLTASGVQLLSPVALTHAALYQMVDMVELLLAYKADPNNQSNTTPLIGAVVAGNRRIVEMLIAKGANPLLEPDEGKFCSDSPLSSALALCKTDLLLLMLDTLPEARQFSAMLCAISRASWKLSLSAFKGLRDARPLFFDCLMKIGSETRQNWLLSLAIRYDLEELSEWLIAQGADYVLTDEHDLLFCGPSCLNLHSLKYLADGIADAFLRQEFLNRQYYNRILEESRDLEIEGLLDFQAFQQTACGGLLQMGAMPFYIPECHKQSGEMDYAFHEAVNQGRIMDVLHFFRQHPNMSFHVPGVLGKFPLEIAASMGDEHMFFWLMRNLKQTLSSGHGLEVEKTCAAVIRELFRRSVVKHHDQRAMQFLTQRLKNYANAYDPKSDLLQRIVKSKDARTMEFLLLCGEGLFIREKIQTKEFSEGVDLAPIRDLLDQSDLVADPKQALTSPVWRGSMTADSLLDELAIQLRKNDDKFSKACVKLGSTSGIVGALRDGIVLLGKGLNFQRAAYYGHEKIAPAIDEQFANFIGFWLPGTRVWDKYLSTKLLNPDKGGQSIELRYALSVKMVTQIRELAAAAVRREARWATELVAELPSIFLGCATGATGKVDLQLLEKKLVERQVFLPNAQRLAFVMPLAYEAVLAAGGNDLDPAKQFPQFALHFHAKVGELFADRADHKITRLSTSDAERNRMRVRPVDPNAPQGGAAADADDGSQIFADALWWQMDAVLNCFGLSIEAQEDYLTREHGAFFQFEQNLCKQENLRNGFRINETDPQQLDTTDPDARTNIFTLSV